MLKGGGFKALIKQGGAKNLYAGVWGNLAGVAPASAVFMAVYEPIKAALNERVPENRSFLAPLGAGSAAGLAASVIRVPTEVVKQRLQSGKHALLTHRPCMLFFVFLNRMQMHCIHMHCHIAQAWTKTANWCTCNA